MKKLTSLFVILALLMLCACGSKTGATADGAAAPGVRHWPGTRLLIRYIPIIPCRRRFDNKKAPCRARNAERGGV